MHILKTENILHFYLGGKTSELYSVLIITIIGISWVENITEQFSMWIIPKKLCVCGWGEIYIVMFVLCLILRFCFKGGELNA